VYFGFQKSPTANGAREILEALKLQQKAEYEQSVRTSNQAVKQQQIVDAMESQEKNEIIRNA